MKNVGKRINPNKYKYEYKNKNKNKNKIFIPEKGGKTHAHIPTQRKIEMLFQEMVISILTGLDKISQPP
jgi:hypothetical protein